MDVSLNGFIPLFGGQEATSDLKLKVSVSGLPADSEGRPRASSELTSVKVFFNGAEMPFGVENVRTYFPKTTISFGPQGKVLKTDAPQGRLPVRLPGLDVKRFPEISYMPLEFPEEGIEVGKEWRFERTYEGVPMRYVAKPIAIKENVAEIEVSVEQKSERLENAQMEEVKAEKDAVSSVKARLSGKGRVHFNLSRGVATEVFMELQADDEATDLKSEKVSQRKLKTVLKVKLAVS